jgi:hypothetical protein
VRIGPLGGGQGEALVGGELAVQIAIDVDEGRARPRADEDDAHRFRQGEGNLAFVGLVAGRKRRRQGRRPLGGQGHQLERHLHPGVERQLGGHPADEIRRNLDGSCRGSGEHRRDREAGKSFHGKSPRQSEKG